VYIRSGRGRLARILVELVDMSSRDLERIEVL